MIVVIALVALVGWLGVVFEAGPDEGGGPAGDVGGGPAVVGGSADGAAVPEGPAELPGEAAAAEEERGGAGTPGE
ncbi:MAG: hypothetical protein ACQCXQ_02310 [Verrucomicrobiales bacterium]|nr:hypothetical protein [Verrucomicrobiota bacterium JB025]